MYIYYAIYIYIYTIYFLNYMHINIQLNFDSDVLNILEYKFYMNMFQ